MVVVVRRLSVTKRERRFRSGSRSRVRIHILVVDDRTRCVRRVPLLCIHLFVHVNLPPPQSVLLVRPKESF